MTGLKVLVKPTDLHLFWVVTVWLVSYVFDVMDKTLNNKEEGSKKFIKQVKNITEYINKLCFLENMINSRRFNYQTVYKVLKIGFTLINCSN